MAVINEVTLADGQATPVNHIFKRVPSLASNIVAFREYSSSVVAAARATITGLFRPAATSNAGQRRKFNIQVPQYNATTKAIEGTVTIQVEILKPEIITRDTAKNAHSFMCNFLTSVPVYDEIVNDDPII